MNLLAHFALADGDPGWLLGALLGDHVKGPLRGAWEARTEQGIRLHRRIDAYIDHHAGRRATLHAMPAPLRRYGGILLDIHDDYLLTRHWPRFHSGSLSALNARVCGLLDAAQDELPASARRHARAVTDHQLLLAFADWTAVAGSVERVALRLRQAGLGEAGTHWLNAQHDALEQRFLAYYPDLITLAAEQKHAFEVK
ncbi:MAG TPA: ACP phosphodiesterase [Spongiibacteraceae bacterium]|nr:ACP phosphodiesterase [Spongiibacteraceae bacterium]HUH36717.1 ACP phosphodiesterase [Spongiibacteraceae bacterium]